jgi:hypothetical protein
MGKRWHDCKGPSQGKDQYVPHPYPIERGFAKKRPSARTVFDDNGPSDEEVQC